MPANAQPGPVAAPAFSPGATQTLRAEFVALTGNDELLEQLGQALDGDSAIRHCETLDGIAEHVSAKRAYVAMLDAREHANLAGVIERIQLLADSCVVVVFAPTEQTSEIATAIRRSAVFAVLPIPVETGKTAAVLAGARDEALSRLCIAAPQVSPEPTSTPSIEIAMPVNSASTPAPQRASEPASIPAGEPARQKPQSMPAPVVESAHRRPSPALTLGATALALTVMAAVWLATRDSGPPETASQAAMPNAPQAVAPISTSPAPASVEPQDGSLEELLVKAESAFRDRRYTAPEADNALEFYRSVLARQPDNGEALEGVQRVRTVIDSRLQAALAERRFDEAAGALARLELIDGADPALAAMAARIVELQVTATLESGDLDRASLLLRDATRAGKLTPNRAANLRTDLERRQSEARAQRQAAEAARRYAELSALDSKRESAESPAREPGTASISASTPPPAGLSAADAGAGPTTDSRTSGTGTAENPSLPRPAQAPATAVRIADFKRTRYVEPVYPGDALQKGVRGEVRLRITVDTEGRVKHAEVISSSPSGVFEESALAAVRRWRFKPIVVNGKAVEASAATTVVFQPDEGARR
jgi:protein TonB